MPGKSLTAGTIQSLAKGLQVLEVIARRDQPASLSDLAREMNMSKSGMYRVLATLCECKYVTRDATSSHYFGRDGSFIACISVSGPAGRLSRAIVDQVGTACREAADAINQALGWPTTKDIAQEREHEAR